MAEDLERHRAFIRIAIEEARAGASKGNPPFGALVVREGRVVARGHNEVVSGSDPTGHAETVALRRAGQALGTPVLSGCTLYGTHEPCPMCAAAAAWARVDRVVFGASSARTGGVRSRARILDLMASLVHPVEVIADVLPEECSSLLPPDHRSS